MAFPPQKKKSQGQPGNPFDGEPTPYGPPQDPFAGGPGGMSPFDPFGGGMGGNPMGPVPPSPFPGAMSGLVQPGRGMNPMDAMMNGLGNQMPAQAPMAQGSPVGPNGLPVGGQLPPTDATGVLMGDFGGSDLLNALYESMHGGQTPGVTQGIQGQGPQDPGQDQMQQLLAAMALSQLGVGGGQQGMAGSSGVDFPPAQIGTML